MIPALLASLIPAFLTALAQSAGTTAGNAIVQGLMPKPKDPQQMSQELAQANQSLADALNRVKDGSPSPDDLWHAGDAMLSVANKQPEYLTQAQEAIKKLSPPNYEFARQLGQTLEPAVARSQDAQSVLAAVGPKPTQASAAQLFVLPEIKDLSLPAEIKTVPWPQNTKFVWPEQIKLPNSASSFTWPGQEKS